jgi:hypothetical protein
VPSRARPNGGGILHTSNAFDRPSSRDEALDRLERQAGPAARQMLEKFLDQIGKVEAEYLDQTSFKDAVSRRRKSQQWAPSARISPSPISASHFAVS